MHTGKKLLAGAVTAAATGAAVIGISVSSASSGHAAAAASPAAAVNPADAAKTTTPIKHVVVIFGENVSFDHYFGTYPYAENKPGEPQFTAAPDTPSVNGLSSTLLAANPNADEPQRLAPSQALTCDQNHGYAAEQSAFDGGLMDQFVQNTTGGGCTQASSPDSGNYGPNGIVMDYYDGNTVTGLWNYAQHFTLNDNSYGTQFGPSSPGAINVISGDTHGAVSASSDPTAGNNVANGTLYGDAEPYYDQCSNASQPLTPAGTPGGDNVAKLSGTNIGDLLNRQSLTWGWFQGGFTPSSYSNGRPVCGTTHDNIGNSPVADYSEHHEPFQYYASTSNPDHLSPAGVSQVGTSAPAGVNHQYDVSWFNQAVANNDMPAVSYLKAPEYEDGHAGYSDPLDEQRFITDEVNQIEQSKDWASTAIVLSYDDSDGWYDHQMGPIIRGSQDAPDTLNGTGRCGSPTTSDATTQDRCGVGPRLPLLVISPWAKQNYVDNTFTEQASIPKFIEDNWNLGRVGGESADAAAGSLMNAFDFNQSYGHAPAIILNDNTGEIEQTIPPAPSTTPPTTTTSTTTSTSTTSTTPTTGGPTGRAGGAGGAPKGHGTVTIRTPKVSCKERFAKRSVALSCTTRGGSRVRTQLRVRLYRDRKLIANTAAVVRNHRARFHVALGAAKRAGRYRFVVSVDAGGKVRAFTTSVRVR